MSDSLTLAQRAEAAQIAELEVRRYFDHYLEDVWPEQQRAIQQSVQSAVREHNASPASHGGVERRLSRYSWILIGVGVGSGAGGLGLLQMLLHLAHS